MFYTGDNPCCPYEKQSLFIVLQILLPPEWTFFFSFDSQMGSIAVAVLPIKCHKGVEFKPPHVYNPKQLHAYFRWAAKPQLKHLFIFFYHPPL